MSKKANIQIRVEQELKDTLTKKASDLGFSNLSEFILFVAQNVEIKVTVKKK